MYFLLKQLKDNFRDRSIVMLDTTSDLIRYGLKAAMMTGHPEDLKEVIDALSMKDAIYHIRIFDKNGIIKFSSNISEINKNITSIEPHHIDFKQIVNKVMSMGPEKKKYLITAPIINEKICQSCHEEQRTIAYLDVETNLTLAENLFYTGFGHMIYLGWAVVIILSIGLYLIFNKFISSPLKKLAIALKDVEKGHLNVQLKGNQNDEISSVFKHFNAMTSNLKSSSEKIDKMHMAELQRLGRLTTLGELTSQTAHEVNNHIAIISSRIDYLSLESKKVEELQKFVEDYEVLQDQISKISYITGNILKYSRKQNSEKKEINLANIIRDNASLYNDILEKKKIKLIVNINAKNVVTVADAVQINQVLTNLINNAADAIHNDGNIIITLLCDIDNNLVLSVEDDGPGIKNELTDEIFSPFFTTKNSKTNTGLGLYIVKKICDNHNAEIHCASDPENCTKFTITFKG